MLHFLVLYVMVKEVVSLPDPSGFLLWVLERF